MGKWPQNSQNPKKVPKKAQNSPKTGIFHQFSGHFCGHFYFQKWAESGQMAKKVTKNHKFSSPATPANS